MVLSLLGYGPFAILHNLTFPAALSCLNDAFGSFSKGHVLSVVLAASSCQVVGVHEVNFCSIFIFGKRGISEILQKQKAFLFSITAVFKSNDYGYTRE